MGKCGETEEAEAWRGECSWPGTCLEVVRQAVEGEAREGPEAEAREGAEVEAREGVEAEVREAGEGAAREGAEAEAREGRDWDAKERAVHPPTLPCAPPITPNPMHGSC